MRRDRVAGTIVCLSEGNISKPGDSRVFCPSSRAFSLFQRGDRMIKLPIDSHLFSSPRAPSVRPSWRCEAQVLPGDHKTRTTRAKLLAHRFMSPIPPLSAASTSRARRLYSSLLSVFDVSEIRLSNMHVGFVWWRRTARCFIRAVIDGLGTCTCIVQLDIFVLHKEEIPFKCITKKLGT